MDSNWSSYRRKQVNISKAVFNDEVNTLLTRHYRYLYSLLVKSSRDQGTFNDTYLKLTYKYNPEKDFIEQFKYYFKLLKGAYFRDNKVTNYQLVLVDNYTDNLFGSDFELEQPVKKDIISMEDLKAKVKAYAFSQKADKTPNKKD